MFNDILHEYGEFLRGYWRTAYLVHGKPLLYTLPELPFGASFANRIRSSG